MSIADEAPDDAPTEELLARQREANERLVVAALRAQEEAEEATERERLAEANARELKARQRELEETAELRETLIGVIGHDLRSPLSSIVLAAETQLARGSLAREDAQLATIIARTGHRMGRMIAQLVEFTRGRLGGGFDLALRPENLGDICRAIAEELRVASPNEIVHAADGDLDGVWDADRLAVVVQNIAGNAVEHAAPGTKVFILSYDDGEGVVCEITNRGPCIPAELLPVIFEPFRRGAGEARRAAGHLGLGLYIASEIVRSHTAVAST